MASGALSRPIPTLRATVRQRNIVPINSAKHFLIRCIVSVSGSRVSFLRSVSFSSFFVGSSRGSKSIVVSDAILRQS
jgi:hypothetical protein